MSRIITRRNFVKIGIQGSLGTAFIPIFAKAALAQKFLAAESPGVPEDPHFFLHIALFGGSDCSYLFDARPLAMTAAKKIQNYSGVDPDLWQGRNGQTAWASPSTQPLHDYRDYFSVINGVIMETGSNGHPQNTNYLLTGSPFGGEYFLPHLNQSLDPAIPAKPLDGLQAGPMFGSLTNLGSVVPLSADSAQKLVAKLKTSSSPIDPTTALFRHIQARYHANAGGDGQFSQGAQRMGAGFDASYTLSNILKQLKDPADPKMGEEEKFIRMVLDLFKLNATRSALLSLGPPDDFSAIDTHAPDDAKKQPQFYLNISEKLALIFKLLKDTPYDSQRSFLDVTTVLYGSEFSRTMRQTGNPIDDTGTDHNNINNSILIGGKGVKGGWVVGSSDFQTADEALSKAHTTFDSSHNQVMGRPFDYTTLRPRADLPDAYVPEDYLNISSVANTIYDLFKVSTDRYRMIRRNSTATYPVLKDLLT